MAVPKIREEEYYTMYTDGSAVTNPGAAGIGYVIKNMKNTNIYSNSLKIKDGINTCAEYAALISGLKSAINLGIKRIQVFSDSSLIVSQVDGQWMVDENSLILYCNESQHLLEKLQLVTIEWIQRDYNKEADYLARLANGDLFRTPPRKRGRPKKKKQ